MELLRALGTLGESPGAEQQRIATVLDLGELDAAAYTDLFALQLYPYASVYVGAEGMLGGEARDRIAGFWRALGLTPPPEPDHLASLFGLCAELVDRATAERDADRAAALVRARSALLWEHVLPWVPLYARKMRTIATGAYRAWAELVERTLTDLALELELPPALPLHLRDAPPLPDPREEGAHPFVQALLAPVRSGVIIVRDDLARASQEAELGLRHGERRFVLTSFFAQERTQTLAWLADEFRSAANAYAGMIALPAPIRAFWIARAHATAALLDTLHVEELRRGDAGVPS